MGLSLRVSFGRPGAFGLFESAIFDQSLRTYLTQKPNEGTRFDLQWCMSMDCKTPVDIDTSCY
ncbi:uncharacterized protein N7469_009990 [Penicillium citrinum]|uniref:Uncharacterized protein n=1 Tax=Penicillium citrinum TaxID=5077 RepID=A0A9W9TFT4_PENCI|nr:uncharacterized protein N7469_009990 [Penicillium citrinum]KAJ5221103.1 hypothetical protein N7469_009990 [Penicillium citrinum]